MSQTISGDQLRAARGMLGWNRGELSEAAGISQETIKNIEHGSFHPQEATKEAIIRTFAMRGVEFTDFEGVRKRNQTVVTYSDVGGLVQFLDGMYEVAKSASKGEICVYGVEDKAFTDRLGKYAEVHIKRMATLGKGVVRCIVKKGDKNLSCESYNEYRYLEPGDFSPVPFYVFDNKFAVVVFEGDLGVSIVQITSKQVHDAYLKQFEYLWKLAIKS